MNERTNLTGKSRLASNM